MSQSTSESELNEPERPLAGEGRSSRSEVEVMQSRGVRRQEREQGECPSAGAGRSRSVRCLSCHQNDAKL